MFSFFSEICFFVFIFILLFGCDLITENQSSIQGNLTREDKQKYFQRLQQTTKQCKVTKNEESKDTKGIITMLLIYIKQNTN